MMNFQEKKVALEAALKRLYGSFGKVKNYGSLFICRMCHGCVLRQVVYCIYQETGLAIEVVAPDEKGIYFVGSEQHAKALLAAFDAGILLKSDTSYYESTPEYEAWLVIIQTDRSVSDEELLEIIF